MIAYIIWFENIYWSENKYGSYVSVVSNVCCSTESETALLGMFICIRMFVQTGNLTEASSGFSMYLQSTNNNVNRDTEKNMVREEK